MDRRRIFRTAVTRLKNAWLVLGITFLLFLAMEGIFSLFFFIKTSSALGSFDARAGADAYDNASWVDDYYREVQPSRALRWEPYVYWRRRPFHGTYINVDANGRRRTVHPPAGDTEASQIKSIYMFGGSTLWGTGVRDRFTIPSVLATELEEGFTGPVRVTNFGESGHVSTQSVIALLRELQKGHIPDVVVFYDGINDTFSAYQQGVAGLPQNEAHRAREFAPAAGATGLLRNALANLATFRFANGLARRLRGVSFPTTPIADPLFAPDRTVDANNLAAEVITTYRSNIEIVKALSRQFGFESLFYWQPAVFHKTKLTDYERAQLESRHYLQPFFEATYGVFRQSGLADGAKVHDISTMFAETEAPRYVDWSHLGEAGNTEVARRIARDVLPLIARVE